MNIDYLREFIELAQCLNFTVASKNLNITQPALSKHILALEKEFGVELLDRNRKSVSLTECGRILFESAGIIVGTYDETKEILTKTKTETPIKIAGHVEDSDIAPLVSMASMLLRENGLAQPNVFRSTEKDFGSMLQTDEIDLFVGYISPSRLAETEFEYRPFTMTHLIAIMNSYHPLASSKSVSIADLKNETLIRFVSDKTNPAWEQIYGVFAEHGITPKTRPVSSVNDVEFFSTPLKGAVLIWKRTQREIGLMLETGQRACVPISDEDALLTAYAVYKAENAERLSIFFETADKARDIMRNKNSVKGD